MNAIRRAAALVLLAAAAACAGPVAMVRPAAGTVAGTIVPSPGALVRFGPGLDQPVMDVDRVDRVETFDGWFRRADDRPVPDETTGRVEAWSRDWLHLADGRGWVHRSTVRGIDPGALPQRACDHIQMRMLLANQIAAINLQLRPGPAFRASAELREPR